MEHRSDCDSCDGEVEDVGESRSDTSISEVEIIDSDSDSSVDIQASQWMKVKNSRLSHSTKHISRA
jgi:hypothetical protein